MTGDPVCGDIFPRNEGVERFVGVFLVDVAQGYDSIQVEINGDCPYLLDPSGGWFSGLRG
jgi:hypothetical protein